MRKTTREVATTTHHPSKRREAHPPVEVIIVSRFQRSSMRSISHLAIECTPDEP
jgi:hypothetical protein